MASTRKAVSEQELRKRRGNDEQEAAHPYGGERAGPPKAKDDYLKPQRERGVAGDLKRSGGKRAPTRARRPAR
jgi:hypothetical protein